MGWTRERWENTRSFDDYNKAVKGYWNNWERQTKWLSREIVYQLIIGNPDIDRSKKPECIQDFYRMSWEEPKEKKPKGFTPEELETIKVELLQKLNK